MTNSDSYIVGHLWLKPVGNLAQTAHLLGEVIGISFLPDLQGQFDEYPAFIAEVDNIQYSLLGIPDPEDDIRDNPPDDFQLIVNSVDDPPTATRELDVSDEIASKIDKDGRLVCWPLK